MKPENLTAWALNELGAEEQARLEAELSANPAVQESADSTKEFCSFLTRELRDGSLALTPEQRAQLFKTGSPKVLTATPAFAPKPLAWWQRPAIPMAAAAGVVLGGLLTTLYMLPMVEKRAQELATAAQKQSAQEVRVALEPTKPVKVMVGGGPGKGIPVNVGVPPSSVAAAAREEKIQKLLAAVPNTWRADPGTSADPLPSVSVAASNELLPPATPSVDSLRVDLDRDLNDLGGLLMPPPSIADQIASLNAADAPENLLGGSSSFLRGTPYYSGLDFEYSELDVSGPSYHRSIAADGGFVVKDAAGALTLPGANTYAGTTSLSGSTTFIEASTGAGSLSKHTSGGEQTFLTIGGRVGSSSGPLQLRNEVATAAANPPAAMRLRSDTYTGTLSDKTAPVAGTGGVTMVGAGTLTLDGTSTFTGGTTITSGGAPVITQVGQAAGSSPARRGGMFSVGSGGVIVSRDAALGNASAELQPVALATVPATPKRQLGDVALSVAPITLPADLGRGVTVTSGTTMVVNNPTPALQLAGNLNYGSVSGVTVTGDPFSDEGDSKSSPDDLSRKIGDLDDRNETYTHIFENPLISVAREPLSTFSIDVDTASYANVRRFLNQNTLPPRDAVRLEELINYFPTSEPAPVADSKDPFRVQAEMAACPWQPQHRLMRINLKGREVPTGDKASNLVFLVDVSGSMNDEAKLPLVQRSLRMLAERLEESDHVSLVTYAGGTQVVLPSTNGLQKAQIMAAIDALQAGGSTHGSAGIKLAYEQAVKGFIKGGVNRVILCTDGDFNVGISSPKELEGFIAEKARSGVFLSVLGFGTGNLKDKTMETLADKGNGNYAYIDSVSEARKVLVEQMQGTLVTIAKDVKIQVEFNPAIVREYRLIGYENRLLAKEDFNDDTKDAGEIGAGHTVTALYEMVPANLPPGAEPSPLVDKLKYQTQPEVQLASPPPPGKALTTNSFGNEALTIKLRYKEPEGTASKLILVPLNDDARPIEKAGAEFKFTAAVAGFGMLLRESSHAGSLTWDVVRQLAKEGKGSDPYGYRGEFLQLIEKAAAGK